MIKQTDVITDMLSTIPVNTMWNSFPFGGYNEYTEQIWIVQVIVVYTPVYIRYDNKDYKLILQVDTVVKYLSSIFLECKR